MSDLLLLDEITTHVSYSLQITCIYNISAESEYNFGHLFVEHENILP